MTERDPPRAGDAYRLKQQALVADLGREALAGGGLDDLLNRAAEIAAEGLGTRFAKVLEYMPSEHRLLVRAGVGWRPGVVGHATVGADLESPAGFALQSGLPVLTNSLSTESRFRTPELLREHGIDRAVNVIISTGQKSFGVLEADAKDGSAFSESDTGFLQNVANLLAVAIERRRADDALFESEERFRVAVLSAPLVVFNCDLDLHYTWVANARDGLKNTEILGRRDEDLTDPEIIGEFADFKREVIASGQGGRREIEIRWNDGTVSHRDVTMEPLRRVDGTIVGLTGASLDITERKLAEEELRALNETLEQRITTEIAERRRAEEALQHAQKMEAVGQLTGGIAHDFNNLLTVITGNLDLIAAMVGDNPRIQRLIEAAQHGAQRGEQLTSRLLAFSRRQALRPETRSLGELTQETVTMLQRLVGETIDLQIDLAADTGACWVDPAQFGSTLLNLVVNARDAMPDGGALLIHTRNVPPKDPLLAGHAEAGMSYVMVVVSDTGVGMTPETLAHATEPFFTTKDVGKGTGLGLSQVYGFARQSGGFLIIESAPGAGTTARILLPRAAAAATPSPRRKKTAERGTETVLVVEDDEHVRQVLDRSLKSLGYRPILAANGADALHRLAEDERIDLMMTDIVMPGGMSGLQLAQEAQQRRPDLKILLTTGYAATERARLQQTQPQIPTLLKPFRRNELAVALRTALDQE